MVQEKREMLNLAGVLTFLHVLGVPAALLGAETTILSTAATTRGLCDSP